MTRRPGKKGEKALTMVPFNVDAEDMVKVAGILVCRMREEVEPELAFRVELDLDVEVSYHI